jgi:hypothetical protein
MRKVTAGLATVLLAVTAILGTGTSASAWSSGSLEKVSPCAPGGAGGMSGSSAPNNPSTGRAYVSTSVDLCIGEQIQATYRLSNGQVSSGCMSLKAFCSTTKALTSSMRGGRHTWVNHAQFDT